MKTKDFYRLQGIDSIITNAKLTTSPYKYFHQWKYDEEAFKDLTWITSETINDKRESILESKAKEVADFSLDIVNWIFAIYLLLYLFSSAMKWLYKK
jgi:hypothetical protein